MNDVAPNEPIAARHAEPPMGLIELSLHDILAAIFRSRHWIIGLAIGGVLVALTISLLVSPVFLAESSVQVDQDSAQVLGTETVDQRGPQDEERFLETQRDIIESRSLALAVADALNLYSDERFLEIVGLGDEEAADMVEADGQQRAVVEALREGLSVERPLDSRIFRIGFSSTSPELATEVANTFAEEFIRLNLQRKFDASEYARDFLEQRLREAQQALIESENAAVIYARDNRIIDIAENMEGSTTRSLTTDTLVRLNGELSEALADRIASEGRWRIARASQPMTNPVVLQHSAIQSLLQERAATEAEYRSQLERRKDDFPEVRQLRARLDEINASLSTLAAQIIAGIESEYRSAVAREDAIRARMADLTNATLREQSAGVRLGVLQRQAETNRAQYEALLARYNELTAEAGVQTNNISLVDRATMPTSPIKPDIPLNLLLGLIAGVALAFFVVLLRDQLFDYIRSPKQVRQQLGLRLLGTVPETAEETIAEEVRTLGTPIEEAFASLRVALSFVQAGGLPKALALTSAHPSEGKSVSSFALARSIARTGQTVVLIDADLRRPRQHHLFGTARGPGLSDVLSGTEQIESVLIRDGEVPLCLIPAGSGVSDPSYLLGGSSLMQLLKELRSRFDHVVIDCPPILNLADAVQVGNLADASVLVVRSNSHPATAISAALRRLQEGGVNIVGAVLNRYDPKQEGYAYSYGGDYKYGEQAD